MIGYTIDKVNVKPGDTARRVIENELNYQILKETSQLVQSEKIIEGFEKRKIRNVPLKGYFMKRLYPQSDFRTMTDIDILVDKKNFSEVEKVFADNGIPTRHLTKSSEIHFTKDLMYFEIHSDLNELDDSVYDDIWDKVTLREGYSYSYEMSREDFYVYLLYHAAKHMFYAGIGIRMVMDIYVYLTAYPDLDFEYIESQLRERRIDVFEKRLRKLAFNWFSDDEIEIDDLGEFILSSGTFGNRDVGFFLDGSRTGRFYWLKQVFLPYDTMKKRYAYLSKLPFLLPFSWVQYWSSRVIARDIRFKEGYESRRDRNELEDRDFVLGLFRDLKLER
jgi:hypothetical protein